MAQLNVKGVTVRYPVFDAKRRTLKGSVAHAVTGGSIFVGGGERGVTYVEALRDVSFSLEKGARLGVFGHNGSGKSTLLKVLAGIFPPQKGTVDVRGSVGSFVDLATGVDGDLTGQDNIIVRGLMMGRSRQQVREKVDSIVDFSGLGDFIHMPIRTYSSGMWARLAFAIATAFESEVILLDEWLSVGDESFQKKAQERLKSVVDKASILVLASQSMDLLRSQCNQIIVLEHGQISQTLEVA